MPSPPGGDVDYDRIGEGYAKYRRPDPRIGAAIHAALGDAKTVLNVGAGAGSYEPLARTVIPIEPAEAMRRQRPPHLAQAIDARAESLPLPDASVDAAMATVTVHQWPDLHAGLRELLRVTRGPIVILTFDGDALDRYWLAHYIPEMLAIERKRYPAIATITAALSAGGRAITVREIPIPIDCTDGFTEAYYARPERFLDPGVRQAHSAWSLVHPSAQDRFVKTLTADLESGRWDERFGRWRTMPQFDGSLRLIVSVPAAI